VSTEKLAAGLPSRAQENDDPEALEAEAWCKAEVLPASPTVVLAAGAAPMGGSGSAAHLEVSKPTQQLASNPEASSQGGEIAVVAAAGVPSSQIRPPRIVKAAVEAEDIFRSWPLFLWSPWRDKGASDGKFGGLTIRLRNCTARLHDLADNHSSVGLDLVKEIRSLLGGAGEYRLTHDLNENEHVKLCLLLSSVGCLDELSSTVPRLDEFNRLRYYGEDDERPGRLRCPPDKDGYYGGGVERPVRPWYPPDKDFHGQLLAAIDPRPNGKKKKKKWLK
jgi:hypothetical protein